MQCKVIIPFVIGFEGSFRSYSPGQIADLDPAEAHRMAAAGIVEIIHPVEAAVLPQAEQAVIPQSKGKKNKEQ